MRFFFIRSLAAFFLLALFYGCAYQAPSRKAPPSSVPPTEPASEPAALTPEETPEDFFGLFLVPHPRGDAESLVQILTDHPSLRLTIIFPPKYFDHEENALWVDSFKILQSSAQIEIAMALDNEPLLPLLGNLKVAGGKTASWGFDFSWREDIAAQIARGHAQYQKRWGELPSGFYPPYLCLSPDVMHSLRRFRLQWVLGLPRERSGVRQYGGAALIVPLELPPLEDPGSFSWGEELAKWVIDQPVSLVEISSATNPSAEVIFLKKLAYMIELPRIRKECVLGKELLEKIRSDHLLEEKFDPFVYNYGPWVRSQQQKLAWQALSEARRAVGAYQNSGQANLQRLDSAFEEIYLAESGPFLLNLGQGLNAVQGAEREFLATLANAYRLSETPIPSNLSRWFSGRGRRRAAASSPAESADRPFFVTEENHQLWNDPLKDDFGGGTFSYPYGPYPRGAFDLSQFKVGWNDTDVTLSASFVDLPREGSQTIWPFVDVYIDVNRVSDAGSTVPLKGRGSAVLERQAAWEYALALSPKTCFIYQSVPGGEPRRKMPLEPVLSKSAKTLAVRIPRKELRGDPRQWRLSVMVMGTLSQQKGQDLMPVPVLAKSGEKNFGGSVAGRTAAPFIDLLASSVDEQINRIRVYEFGGKIIVPFVEGQ